MDGHDMAVVLYSHEQPAAFRRFVAAAFQAVAM
jgi:hypothetical protein